MSKDLKESRRMMSYQVENINKELKVMKKNEIEILDFKSIITEMNKSLERLSNRSEQVEERISKLEDKLIEIIWFQEQKRKK